MPIKLLSLFTFSLLLLSFSSKAADKNYASFNTAVKTAVIDNELEQAIILNDLHIVLMKMGKIILMDLGDTCKEPKESDFKALCADIGSKAKAPIAEIEYYEYTYEKRILQLACVDLKVDNEETIKQKVKTWWNKYKISCKCDSVDFGLQNGNILKFALSQSFPEVGELLASFYGCDINFIDPADGLNLLDYINLEIARLKELINSEHTVAIWESYKAYVIGLGGKSNRK